MCSVGDRGQGRGHVGCGLLGILLLSRHFGLVVGMFQLLQNIFISASRKFDHKNRWIGQKSGYWEDGEVGGNPKLPSSHG